MAQGLGSRFFRLGLQFLWAGGPRTRGENPGLGLERRPGRALGIYLRLRHDDSLPVSLSPRALLGILLPGLVWLVYYLAAYSARSRPAMPAGTCPEPISPYIPPYLSIRILAYGTTYSMVLAGTVPRILEFLEF